MGGGPAVIRSPELHLWHAGLGNRGGKSRRPCVARRTCNSVRLTVLVVCLQCDSLLPLQGHRGAVSSTTQQKIQQYREGSASETANARRRRNTGRRRDGSGKPIRGSGRRQEGSA